MHRDDLKLVMTKFGHVSDDEFERVILELGMDEEGRVEIDKFVRWCMPSNSIPAAPDDEKVRGAIVEFTLQHEY